MAKYVHAPLLTTALTLGVALSAATAAVSSAAAEELQWATQAGGTGGDFGFGIATDGPGNSYVTGAFSSTTTFGAGEDNETELTAAGGSDVFVAKYDRNGQLLWATLAGGTGTDWGNGIAIDGPGNSYVAGIFQGIATFGEGEDNETGLTASGSFDAFVAKYDRNGDLLWAKQASGTSNEIGWGIATDSRGNSYVSGYFSGTATFGDGENNETRPERRRQPRYICCEVRPEWPAPWATRAGGASNVSGGDQGMGSRQTAPGTATSPALSPARRRSERARAGQRDRANCRGQPF